MRRVSLVFTLFATLLMSLTFSVHCLAAGAQDTPQAPPEIQRILDKLKNGGRPTADDIKKITEWSKNVQKRFNNPATNGSQFGKNPNGKKPVGIPCDVSMTATFTKSKSGDGLTEDENGRISIHTKAVLFANVRGTGDYFKDILNPDVDASSFRFEPEADPSGTKLTGSGGGSVQFTTHSTFRNGFSTDKGSGSYTKCFCSMLFVTSGSDKLFCTGVFGGVVSGKLHETSVQGNQTDTRTVDLTSFSGASDTGIPFASEAEAWGNWVKNHSKADLSMAQARASFRSFAAAVSSGGSRTIEIPESFSFTNQAGYHISGVSQVRITLRPPPLELVVEPESYETWVPEGASDESKPGNRLNIKASLRAKGGKPLAASIAVKKFTFTLEKRSKEPGVAMNWPVKKPDDEKKPDMKFEASENPTLSVTGEDGSVASTVKSAPEATARLTSFDWGGWADLKVTAELPDGTVIQGHIAGMEQEDSIRLPKRKDDSHIADAWKKYMSGVCGRDLNDLKDEDDSENIPVGDGNKGDGYTLYEEYRGFYEKGKHFRASPGKKKLFVHDEVGDRSKDGIALFRQATKIEVHDDFTSEEFGRPSAVGAEDYVRTKILNENHAEGAHVVDQHGVVLLQSLEQVSYAQALTKIPDGPIGTPKNYRYIEITSAFDPGPEGWNSAMEGGTLIISDNYAKCIAHEMLHCCAVWHHGDTDEGRLTIKRNPTGTDLGYDTNNGWYSIVLKDENDNFFVPEDAYWDTTRTPWYGAFHGQHSGVTDCLMTYDVARLYAGGGNVFYYILGSDRQLAGIGLCTSPEGTGTNKAGRKPQPRYGDADAGRGDCTHKICVNDLYH